MLKRHDLADPASDAPAAPLSNGGPPLDDSPRPWGNNGIGNYFEWKAASEKAFNDVPYDIAVMRARRAEAMGLTYREYTLEILERGRYLSAEADAERIAEIKRRRSIRY
ncbi:MAG: hypothetical protein J0H80_09560 [Rhizobiales bacterium]|uniref:hypothetical protein n=1 Tax=unclassified Devosia TaxID=196773 RepID=UPI00086F2512|nr:MULTISPECIES: hypothetical protein [unclassified Devosia]MBN9053998.1 hypothetical protein [Hyphomicrobiales bacterium]MBN9363998.1 hypothetical protein [Devosia sp.]ODS82906.1 MAG: hypothetical protein ABS47_21770 [Devosia sp. SCN 66-27]OJX27260.1 MAG: hypothetical protein BGO83_26090 [Devosia sp. 66-14]